MLRLQIFKDPNDLIFILRKPGFIKSGYKHNMSSFKANIIGKSWIWRKTRKINFLRYTEKLGPRFWICCLLSYFPSLTTKILAGAVGAHPVLAPGMQALKNRFLPILGPKNFEIPKFFFLQISLFIGPIGGTNNNFLSGLPIWLYSDFQFWARILDPNFEMGPVPRRLGPGPKLFRQMNQHTGQH